MKRIVVSAVNIRKGGTLTILRDCLRHLSAEAEAGRLEVIALVHSRELCGFPAIDYIEMPDSIRSWARRLRHEYVTMNGISRRITRERGPIDLWLSLHDTTPRVLARRQAVYCQTSFPFMRWKWRDFRMDFKIPLFAMLTRFAYRINVRRNYRLIVQQRWLRTGLGRMLGIAPDRFIVAPPRRDMPLPEFAPRRFDRPTFFFASTPDCHKNFEVVCRAAEIIENRIGHDRFQFILTVDGSENRYARYLKAGWGHVSSIRFEGLMDRPALFATYAGADCLVFMSRIETWGLPVSEFMNFDKPMILADLPYARETAAGSRLTAFCPVDNAEALASLMTDVIGGDMSRFSSVAPTAADGAVALTWHEIFNTLV